MSRVRSADTRFLYPYEFEALRDSELLWLYRQDIMDHGSTNVLIMTDVKDRSLEDNSPLQIFVTPESYIKKRRPDFIKKYGVFLV